MPRPMLAVALSNARPSGFLLDEAVRLLRKGRERRVGAAEPDDEADPQPVRCVMPVDESCDQQADEKAAGQVDGERAPGKQ